MKPFLGNIGCGMAVPASGSRLARGSAAWRRYMRRAPNQRSAAARGLGAALLLAAATLAGCGDQTSGPPAGPTEAPAPKVSPAATVQANPASVEGFLDVVNADVIAGWAMDTTHPTNPVTVELYDGDALLVSVPANQFRQDLLDAGKGDGYHAFTVPTPARVKDGKSHTIRVTCAGLELKKSPQTMPAR